MRERMCMCVCVCVSECVFMWQTESLIKEAKIY